MNKVFYKISVFMILCGVFITSCGKNIDNDDSAMAMRTLLEAVEPSEEETAEYTDHMLLLETGVVSTDIGQKYTNGKIMLTCLVNEDIIVEEMDNEVYFYTPSGNAQLSVQLVPGIQNLTAVMDMFMENINNYFQGSQAGDITEIDLMGYKGKAIPFNITSEDENYNGFIAGFIANQSLYSATLICHENATASEVELMYKIVPTMYALQPIEVQETGNTSAKTNQTKKTAKYRDPYAGYNLYDPYYYGYMQGLYDFEQYVAYLDYYNSYLYPEDWYYTPDYYYSLMSDPPEYDIYADYIYYEPDWNYYTEDTYWAWDDTYYDWGFYDEYSDYYSYDYYDDLDYYYDYYDDYTWEEEYYSWDESDGWNDYYDFDIWEDYEYASYYEDNDYYQEDNYEEDNYEVDNLEEYYYEEDNYEEDNYEEDNYEEDYYEEDYYEEDSYEEDYYEEDSYEEDSYEEDYYEEW